ncbi:putative phosphohydrolase [Xenococcus sp. PCC 7305]|uniref:metallophosphoesterase n=1 Tax=Xenococcus sp. PCC 7305 TaxID=102125 RepID=UPI0002ACD1B3|nr:metallophosphoesterase [Xenococcus sp. PCC 7305]ELS02341.1 putative phosphohydrolase [Xenococcus sp. PCC 7305]
MLAVFTLVYTIQIEPYWFEIVSVNITIPQLAPAFKNFKIVQISDLHVDTSMNRRKLDKIVQIINQQQPDIVAITGDFFTYKPDFVSTNLLTNALQKLTPKEKTIAVLGNHDYYSDPSIIRKILAQSNVLELENNVYTIKRGLEKLQIAGLDDYLMGKSRLDLVLAQLVTDDVTILLVHEPDFADISAPTGKFDLEISGHSHGGQVRFPFRQPDVLPPYGRKYPLGRYQIGNMIQYTNRGVGMIPPAIRFNSRPEITVFILNEEKNS